MYRRNVRDPGVEASVFRELDVPHPSCSESDDEGQRDERDEEHGPGASVNDDDNRDDGGEAVEEHQRRRRRRQRDDGAQLGRDEVAHRHYHDQVTRRRPFGSRLEEEQEATGSLRRAGGGDGDRDGDRDGVGVGGASTRRHAAGLGSIRQRMRDGRGAPAASASVAR